MSDIGTSVVVPVWNQLRLSTQLLKCLDMDPMSGREVIWVDNGSTDGTSEFLDRLCEERPRQHRVIHFLENQGFGAAMNAGASAASGEFLVLLNNDTEPSPGLLAELAACLRFNPSFGIVSPRVTQAGIRMNVFPGADPDRGPEVLKRFGSYPSGVCYATPRELFDSLGGFDAATFKMASAEDADLCYKMWDAGREVAIHHGLCLKHIGAGTSSSLPDKTKIWQRNSKLFEGKWKATLAARGGKGRAIMLGLGASGTSYYAALADRMGWTTPRPHKGHMPFPTHETKRGREINERLVEMAGRHVYDTGILVPAPPPDLFREAQQFVADADVRHDRWLFKDPRSTLTHDALWRHLGWEKVVCVYRHPDDTLASLRKHHVRGALAEESSLRALWLMWSRLMLRLPDAKFIRFPGDGGRLADILGCDPPDDTGFESGMDHGDAGDVPDWATVAWDEMEARRIT